MTDATRTKPAGKQRGGSRRAGGGTEPAPETRSDGGLHMHTLHAKLPIPYLTPNDIAANAHTAGSKLPSLPAMPEPKRLAFYGGLGALAIFGAIDWPVAVAIGAATVIARGGRRDEENGNGHGEKRAEEGAAKPAGGRAGDARRR